MSIIGDLNEACKINNVKEVKRLLLDTAYAAYAVNFKSDYFKYSSLMCASMKGHHEIVKLLLLSGADVNDKNKYNGYSSLMYASKNGHHEIVKILLLNGADVNDKNDDGQSSLMCASIKGHLEVVKLLLLSGADVHAKNNYGESSLMCAYSSEIVKLLILNGADVNAVNNYGYSSLMFACKNGFTEVIEVLLISGANIYSKGENAFTIAKNEEVRNVLFKYSTKCILKEVPHDNIIDDNINYLS